MDTYGFTDERLSARQTAMLGGQRYDVKAATERDASQVDEALAEHALLLSQLSEEVCRTREQFRAVLLPELPANSCGEAAPAPMRSPLADAIVGQSQLVRSILGDLRSINNRSTV